MGAPKSGMGAAGRSGAGRSVLTLECAGQAGTTVDYDSRVLAVIRGQDGPTGLVYTAQAIDPDRFTGQVRGRDEDRVAVVRRFDFGKGVIWEHPFPYFDAFEDGHYARVGDVLVLPSLEGLAGLDVHSGESRWSLRRGGRVDEELLVNDRGEVLAIFSDESFVRVAADSGQRAGKGRVDGQEQDPREECMNPLWGGEPDRIQVGDKVGEAVGGGMEIRDLLPTDGDGEYVHSVDVDLGGVLRNPPGGATVSTETMRVVAPGVEDEYEYGLVTIPVSGWEVSSGGSFVHGDRLVFAVAREDRVDEEERETTTGLAVYELSTMRQRLLVKVGKPGRRRASIDGVYGVDGYAVVRMEDSAVFGDDFDPDGGIPHYDVQFLVDLESGLSPVVARLAGDDRYLSRVFRGRDEVWAGLL